MFRLVLDGRKCSQICPQDFQNARFSADLVKITRQPSASLHLVGIRKETRKQALQLSKSVDEVVALADIAETGELLQPKLACKTAKSLFVLYAAEFSRAYIKTV